MSEILSPVPKTHPPRLYCPVCHTQSIPWGWMDAPHHINGEACGCRSSICPSCLDCQSAETRDLNPANRRQGERRTK